MRPKDSETDRLYVFTVLGLAFESWRLHVFASSASKIRLFLQTQTAIIKTTLVRFPGKDNEPPLNVREDAMTTDDAKRMVARLRRWGSWRTLPQSDVALIRSQAEANENGSFMLAFMLFVSVGNHCGPISWWDLSAPLTLAFIIYCRIEAGRLREAMRLFEEQGPQMVEDLKN
jgi:hypothetical protein